MQSNRILSNLTMALAVMLLAPLLNVPREPADAACCYFAAKDKDINQPGQKAFISWNPITKNESFTVQPKFEGNAVDFGMVIPSPSRPKLDEMPRDFFKNLALYTILMPLPQPIYTPLDPPLPPPPCAAAGFAGGGGGGMSPKKEKVRVLESGVVGSLDYKIIVADEATALFQWLKTNHYSYGGDESTLEFYIKKKWFFTVMKIDSKQMKKASDGSYLGEVTPTRFAFSSEQCIYPLKITQISVKDKTEALFYVQAPGQMDLESEWSWMHSYRPMFLNYMLGCSADPHQQEELQTRTLWLQKKQAKDPKYETTKLEWAKKLGDAEMSVLDDPLKNYGQAGTGDLPPGARAVTLDDFMKELKDGTQKHYKGKVPADVQNELARMGDIYQPSKGIIVKNDEKSLSRGFISTRYSWYPAREVPRDEVKGLALLKGHLQKGQWLTKFRKNVRKDEMTKDLILTEVPKLEQQTYFRVMPTSPP